LQNASSSLGNEVGRGWSGMTPTYMQMQGVKRGSSFFFLKKKKKLEIEEHTLSISVCAGVS